MLLGIGDVADGVPSGRDLQRTAASSALRRLVLAAAACDGAAGAAATAADEIAQLRADVQRAARDEHRAQVSSCQTWPASGSLKEQEHERINDAGAAGRAAQARADAALKAHRRAQLALRETDIAGREADRREVAVATAAAAEMKEQLAALRGELAAQSAAREKAALEALNLSHKLRSAELEAQREGTAMKWLEGELEMERMHKATEMQSAMEAKQTSMEARSKIRESMAEADAAWASREACMDEVNALRASLQAAADRVAWGQQETASERHAAAAQVHTMEARTAEVALQHHVSATCAARRETAASHLLSSLLAAQLERLLLGTLHAWRDVRVAGAQEAKWRAEVEAARQSSTGLMQSASLRESVSEAILARREEAGRRMLSSVLAAQLEILLSGVFAAWYDIANQQHGLSELADEKNEVARLRRILESKESELAAATRVEAASGSPTQLAENAVAIGLKMECEQSLLLRHAGAARSVLASVLSSQWALTVKGTFDTWLHMTRCPQDDLLSNNTSSEQEALIRTLTLDIRAERDVRTSLEENLRKSEDNAEKLRHEVDAANAQVQTLRQATTEAAAFKAATAEEVEGQRRSALSVSFARLLAGQLEYIVWCAFVRWQASSMSSLQQPAQPCTSVQGADGQIEQLKEELQHALAEERSAKLQLVNARNETSSYAMEISELRAASRAAGLGEPAIGFEGMETQAAVAEDAVNLREQAYVALITRRELSCHRMLAQTMAAHLEFVVRGAFLSWRLGCTELSASDKHGGNTCNVGRPAPDPGMALPGIAQHGAEIAGSAPCSQDNMASVALFYMQQEARVRAMCVTLLASKVEQTVRGAFGVWRDFLTMVQREAKVHSSIDCVAHQQKGIELAAQNTLVKTEESIAICFAQREAITRRVLAMLLARQLEVCLLGAFAAWRAGVIQSDQSSHFLTDLTTNTAGRIAGREGFASDGVRSGHRQHSDESIAGSLSLLFRSELAARHVCASLLARQMEMLISGTFHSWKDIAMACVATSGNNRGEVPRSPSCAASLQGTHQRGMQVCYDSSDNGSE